MLHLQSLSLTERRLCQGGGKSVFPSDRDRMRGNSFKLFWGRFGADIRKNYFSERMVIIGLDLPEKWWNHHLWRCLRKCVYVALKDMVYWA